MGIVLSKDRSCQSSDISSTQVDSHKKDSESILKNALTKEELSLFNKDEKSIKTDIETKDISSTPEKFTDKPQVEETEFLNDKTRASDSEMEFEELSNSSEDFHCDLITMTEFLNKVEDSIDLPINQNEAESDVEASLILKEIQHLRVMQNVKKSVLSNEAAVLAEPVTVGNAINDQTDLTVPDTTTETIVTKSKQKNKYTSLINEYKIKIETESIPEQLQLNLEANESKTKTSDPVSSNSLNDIGEVVDLTTVNIVPGFLDLTGDINSEEVIDLTARKPKPNPAFIDLTDLSAFEETPRLISPISEINDNSDTDTSNTFFDIEKTPINDAETNSPPEKIVLPSTATLKNVLAQLPSVQSLITKPVNNDKEIESDILKSINELINGTDESEIGPLSVLLPELNKLNSSQEITVETIINVSVPTIEPTTKESSEVTSSKTTPTVQISNIVKPPTYEQTSAKSRTTVQSSNVAEPPMYEQTSAMPTPTAQSSSVVEPPTYEKSSAKPTPTVQTSNAVEPPTYEQIISKPIPTVQTSTVAEPPTNEQTISNPANRTSLLPANVWNELETLMSNPPSKIGTIKLRQLPGDCLSEHNVIPVSKLNDGNPPPLKSKPDSFPAEATNPTMLIHLPIDYNTIQNNQALRNVQQNFYTSYSSNIGEIPSVNFIPEQYSTTMNHGEVLPAVTEPQIQSSEIWCPSVVSNASTNIIRPNMSVAKNKIPKVKKTTPKKKGLSSVHSSTTKEHRLPPPIRAEVSPTPLNNNIPIENYSSPWQQQAPSFRAEMPHPVFNISTAFNKIITAEQHSSPIMPFPTTPLASIANLIRPYNPVEQKSTPNFDSQSIKEKVLPAVKIAPPPQQRSMPIIDEIFAPPPPAPPTVINQEVNSSQEMLTFEQEVICLRPWITLNNFKTALGSANMLTNKNIFNSLYKCMELNCSTVSDDCNEFLAHVKQHERTAEEKIATGEQSLDTESWLCCSYCEYIADSCNLLLKHINMVHSTSIYNCSNCFYRASVAFNVQTHYKQYHPEKEVLINVGSSAPLEFHNEIKVMMDSMETFVMGIVCEEGWFFIFKFQ